jgi:TatD DNase family protein
MFIDTHGHLSAMITNNDTKLLTPEEIKQVSHILHEAEQKQVTIIINVSTNSTESKNAVQLAKKYTHVYAAVGLHPNDCTPSWHSEIADIHTLIRHDNEHVIVGVGECGLDMHYPEYNLSRQIDAFRTQIELALQYNLALVVHSRNAYDETLTVLDEYKNDIQRGVIHCFSYDQKFADQVIAQKLLLGIGGTVTYPKNTTVQTVVKQTSLEHIVLETDAPFLAPQQVRGQKNHPKNIPLIAQYIAELRNESILSIAQQTTKNALQLFKIEKNRKEHS